MDDATHHWPMDKLDGGGLGDIAGYKHGHVEGAAEIITTGPIVHHGLRTAAVSLKKSDNSYVDLGDFSALQFMNLDWATG